MANRYSEGTGTEGDGVKIVALIPARAGSKRIPGKNMRPLAGRPLIAYTIMAALESRVFSDVLICSDDDHVFAYALGCEHVSYRSRPPVPDDQPDIEWVRDALDTVTAARLDQPNAFAILRPTSPFRTAETIKRAIAQFQRSEVHSLRAVQPVREHPGKMWLWEWPGFPMTPLWNRARDGDTPFHSRPTQTLPQVYVQNASLEIAWSYVVNAFGTISGTKVAPFFTEGYEGFDLNTEEDWQRAEQLIASGAVTLPDLTEAHVT